MNLKLMMIAGAVAAVGLAMGQGAAKSGAKTGQGGPGKGMMRQGGPGQMRMPSADERVKMMTKMLNLTPAQQKKLKPIYEASGKKMKAIMDDKKMTQDKKRAAMTKLRDDNRKKIAAILTKEQMKKLESMRRSFGQGRGPGGPGGAGAAQKASGRPPGVDPNGTMKKGKHGGVGG